MTSKLIAKYATLTVTVSKAVQNHLNQSGYFKPNSIKVIYNGVDANRFNPDNDSGYPRKEWNIPKDAPVVGMIERINRWKRHGSFLKSARDIFQMN